MPTRPFDCSTFSSIAPSPLSPSLHMSSFGIPLSQTGLPANSGLDGNLNWPIDVIVDHAALGKGVRWALGIESVAAVGIYALWHLWILIR